MTIRDALVHASRSLQEARVETPRLDAEILLTHLLKKNTAYLLVHPEVKLTLAIKRRFFAIMKRRAQREPLAYITGHKEFYGLDFMVNRAVLIPRPETETLIETITNLLRTTYPTTSERNPELAPRLPSEAGGQRAKRSYYLLPTTIIDVGTGSGALAVTLAKLLPHATVYATDTSATALRVARVNAKRHGVSVHFKKGNLLLPLGKLWEEIRNQKTENKGGIMIVANLPYLTTAQWRAAQPEVKKYEPRTALDGGPDGLQYYRQLLKQIESSLITNYSLLITLYLEIDPRQTQPLAKLIRKTFPHAHIQIKKDLAGRDRVLIAHLPSVGHLSPLSK